MKINSKNARKMLAAMKTLKQRPIVFARGKIINGQMRLLAKKLAA